MSSILDALRKVEREKAEVTQPVEADFDEAAAERDLIGGTDGHGRMVLHLPPWMLMAVGGAFVLAVVASAGLAWLWTRGSTPEAPVAVASYVPPPAPKAVVAPAPTPEPPAPVVIKAVPVEKEPEPVVVAKVPAPELEPPVVKPVEPEQAATEDKAAVEPSEPKVKPAPEAVQVAKVEPVPAPLPELPKPAPVVKPTIGEPLKSMPLELEPAATGAPAEPEEPAEGAVLPPTEEDRRTIKLNMPRPANKRNPYASAIINLQPVFLNEMIPNTTAKLVAVQEKGVIILKQDTGTRHYIPF